MSDRSISSCEQDSKFLALLSGGVSVIVHSQQSWSGPPLPAILRLELDSNQVVLDFVRRPSSCWRKKQTIRAKLQDLQWVVSGAETTAFHRTKKFLEEEQHLDTYLNSFSLLFSTSEGLDNGAGNGNALFTLDLEIPSANGGYARKQRLVKGFCETFGVEQILELKDIPEDLRRVPNDLSMALHKFTFGKFFVSLIYLSIMISILIMACSSPLIQADPIRAERYKTEVKIAEVMEQMIVIIFTLEVVLKIISRESFAFYLTDSWNVLDFSIVLITWVTELTSQNENTTEQASSTDNSINLTSFRALRALRALRAFRILEGLREVVQTFLMTLKSVSQGLVILFYTLTLFTLFSMELWGERLSSQCINKANQTFVPAIYCNTEQQCPPHSQCVARPIVLFQSFSSAFLTLYKVSFRTGAGPVLVPLMSAQNATLGVVFFLFLCMFVSQMVLNVFVALIRNTFASTRKLNANKKALLEEKNKFLPSWKKPKKNQQNTAKVAPTDAHTSSKVADALLAASQERNKGALQRLADSKALDLFISAMVFANIICMGLPYYEQPATRQAVLETFEVVFAAIFAAEVILKLCAHRVKFFTSRWNTFDFLLVAISIVDLTLGGVANLTFLRMLRLLRVLRLLRKNPEVVQILKAIQKSAPAMVNLALFTIKLLSVFAILGMQLFGARMNPVSAQDLVQHNKTFDELYKPPKANFDTFWNAMLALFMSLTGGAMWGIYDNATKTSMGWLAPIFFFVFSVFTSVIILNFLVVLVMAGFAKTEQELAAMRKLREEAILSALRRKDNGKANADNEDIEHPIKSSDSKSLPQRIVDSTLFQGFIILCILVSSGLLTLEAPIYADNDAIQTLLNVCEVLFLIVFLLELVLKVMAFGWAAYIHNHWNKFDVLILLGTIAGMLSSGGSAAGVLRIGRILRPLRMLNRNEGLKCIIEALLRAIRPVSYAVILLVVYFYAFAIMGLQFFMGSFAICNDSAVLLREQCVGHFVDSRDKVLKPRVWKTLGFTFDDLGSALSTLFEVISLKAWPEKLWVIYDVGPGFSVYLVVFIFVGSFFLMRLFVGIIVGTYRSFSGNLLLTHDQLQWLEMRRVMSRMQPHVNPPANVVRRMCFHFTSHPHFELFQAILTVVHVALVALLHILSHRDFMRGIGAFFATVYLVSHLLRVAALGPVRLYTKVGYNPQKATNDRFVCFSRVYEGITAALGPFLLWANIPVLIPILRALDLSRLRALFHGRTPRLFQVISVLLECIPPMLNVTFVLCMVLFMFAVLGMQFFGQVKHGFVLGSSASFSTFPDAIFTLFFIVSGDNWIPIMRDCQVQTPYCEPEKDCGSRVLATIYFFTLFLLVFGVFLSLYAATIIDAYESKSKLTDVRWKFSENEFRQFEIAWKHCDHAATGRISVKLFRRLFFSLPNQFTNSGSTQQYNQARLEIFKFIKTSLPCSLPNGGQLRIGEPSVGFFECLEVIVLVNVDPSSLEPAERIERLRKAKVIKENLSAMRIQAFLRGCLHQRYFRALLESAKTFDFDNLDHQSIHAETALMYERMYGKPPPLTSTKIFLGANKDEVAFENLRAEEKQELEQPQGHQHFVKDDHDATSRRATGHIDSRHRLSSLTLLEEHDTNAALNPALLRQASKAVVMNSTNRTFHNKKERK